MIHCAVCKITSHQPESGFILREKRKKGYGEKQCQDGLKRCLNVEAASFHLNLLVLVFLTHMKSVSLCNDQCEAGR